MSEKFLIIKIIDFFFQKEKSNNCHLTTNQKTLSGRQYELKFFAPKAKVWVLILEMGEENFKIR